MIRSKKLTASGDKFSAEEIRKIVDTARKRGLIHGGDVASVINKNGDHATKLGAVESQWMMIDPDTAQRWLKNNFRNRRVSEDVVKAYARDMINGVWMATHQGVAFNDRDELIDGQHRLMAVVRSGKTIRMMVTFGLPSEVKGQEMTTMDAVDRGRTRSVADQLKIQHGLKNGSVIASIATSIGSICYGERTRRLSVGQTLEIYRAFESSVNFVILHRPKQHGLRAVGVCAAFAFAMADESESDGEIYCMYNRLMLGEDLKKGSAITLLHTFLTSPEAQLLNRGTDRGISELVLQAIYLDVKKQKIRKLKIATDGIDYFRSRNADRVEKISAIFRLPVGD